MEGSDSCVEDPEVIDGSGGVDDVVLPRRAEGLRKSGHL